MAPARSGEVEDTVEKSWPFGCLIRSVRVEQVIERRGFPLGSRDGSRA
jgi:hypothetical protein